MKYFPLINNDRFAMSRTQPSIAFELRANIALNLIEHWGAVAAKIRPEEDTAGRAVLDLQNPKELVQRCFNIAEEFINVCEEKDYIKEIPALEEVAK